MFIVNKDYEIIIKSLTWVVLHDEARLVTRDSHQIRRQRIFYLNEATAGDDLAAARNAIRRLPRNRRV